MDQDAGFFHSFVILCLEAVQSNRVGTEVLEILVPKFPWRGQGYHDIF